MSLQKNSVKRIVAGILIDLHFHNLVLKKKSTKIAAVNCFELSVLREKMPWM